MTAELVIIKVLKDIFHYRTATERLNSLLTKEDKYLHVNSIPTQSTLSLRVNTAQCNA